MESFGKFLDGFFVFINLFVLFFLGFRRIKKLIMTSYCNHCALSLSLNALDTLMVIFLSGKFQ